MAVIRKRRKLSLMTDLGLFLFFVSHFLTFSHVFSLIVSSIESRVIMRSLDFLIFVPSIVS